MKLITTLLILVTLTGSALAQKQKPGVLYDVDITRVKDGDTIAFRAPWVPDPLPKELAVRIFGVDTPEKGFRAQCPAEEARGQAATKFTIQAVTQSQRRQLNLMAWDKFGGRVLGDVILDGKSLRQMLIANGYAREYYGETKQSWCQ